MVRRPRRVVVLVHAPGHAHEAEHVQRHEGQVEADHPAGEGPLAQALVEGEAEHLREPVGKAGQVAEQRAADDGVVEVCDQEQAVVQQEVRARDGQQHAGHATDGEGDQERDGPQHRHAELDAAAVHGEQPGEDLHAGGNGDDHRHDAEEGIDAGTGAHGEEVVQPDDERQDADGRRGVHHRLVAEQRLARERRDNFRECAERRQDQDVDLGVAPDPDQVDVHHRVSTKLVGEEMHVEVPVHGQQRQGRRQHR
ncbi:hypothetical protein G6F68_012647 [Rhizopus microsporus]|nr:hypothetical protein G6F68_012647 [Rhizopus microsporus]